MSTGGIILVILAAVGYFALFPAMVTGWWLIEEGRYEESDFVWRRVYWLGAVVCLLALYLIYRMSHMG